MTSEGTARCPSCSSAVGAGGGPCATCGAAVEPHDLPTGTAPARSPAGGGGAHGPPAHREDSPGARGGRAAAGALPPRLVPGTVLGERYRIVQLLGRGGMGEVYRADDLVLGESVALKFLRFGLRDDRERIERLFGEVRIARRISHPAVCRVHDIGEAGGQRFLTMEFVDGENLAALMRRIGRLPRDKALEISRQLCAGLAAAHAGGVLHRDLKPQNVMLDGRGQVRLTDFGLAVEGASGDDLQAGTPAYMSPEQLEGREVSVRSDLYAMGLLLYELFTGRRAFDGRSREELGRQHRLERPVDPREHVPDLDAETAEAILRCLEKDPAARPPSALAVAASLPGGDLLAAAVAAGITPSPEMVAAAGPRQRAIRPALAAALAGVALAATALVVPLAAGRHLFRRVPFEKPPAALEDRARSLLERLGYPGPAADAARGFDIDEGPLFRIQETDRSPGRWRSLSSGQPPVLLFWYRDGPRSLMAMHPWGEVSFGDPPPLQAGMRGLRYDTRGRLVHFYAVPPQREADDASRPRETDWSPLFREAGLDPGALRPSRPLWTPPHFADARAAWEGSWPERPDVGLRVEAAAYRGRPVYFQLLTPWAPAERETSYALRDAERTAGLMTIALLAGVVLAALLLARRNLSLGRGDRHGATRLAGATLALLTLAWLQVADHVADPLLELSLAIRGIGLSLTLSAVLWVCYLAAEPYVRRGWPHALISWTRLLSGRWRDPLLGRDILVGAAAGAGTAVFASLGQRLPLLFGDGEMMPQSSQVDSLIGARRALAELAFGGVHALGVALFTLLVIFVLRLLVRRPLPAILLALAVFCVPESLTLDYPFWIVVSVNMALAAMTMAVLVRFGLLAAWVATYVQRLLVQTPLTPDLTSWSAGPTLQVLAVIGGLVFFGVRAASGGRPLLGRLLPAK